MLQMLRKMSPLSDEMDEKYIHRITVITKSMVRGVFVLAVAQGLTMGFFFWIGEVKYASFWMLISIFMAMLPLGCGVVAVPIGIIHIILGNVWQGIVILLGYAVVVSGIQYYLTPRLVSREARLNSALVLLSVFGGLKMFGFMGLVYGPVIMIFLVTTIEIYMDYYRISKSATLVELARSPAISAPGVPVRGELAPALPARGEPALASPLRREPAVTLPFHVEPALALPVQSAGTEESAGIEELDAVREQEEAIATEEPRPWSVWSAVRRLPQIATLRVSAPWGREQDGR
jgi:hypothetical protein